MVPDRKYKPTYTGSKQQTKPTTSPGFAKSKIEMLDNSTSVSYYYGKCESTSETVSTYKSYIVQGDLLYSLDTFLWHQHFG